MMMLPGPPAVQLYGCNDPDFPDCKQPAGSRCVNKRGKFVPPHPKRWNLGTGYADAFNAQQTKIDNLTHARDEAHEDAAREADRVDELEKAVDLRDSTISTLTAGLKTITKERDALQAQVDELTKPQPEPAPEPKTLFGYWAGTDTNGAGTSARENYERVQTYMGTPQVYRMFYSGLPQQSFTGSNADYGPPVVVSFKAPPSEILAGKHDAYLTSWFHSIPEARQVWWSYWHEPEDDIEDGRFTPEQYRAAWEHILALAPKRKTLRATLILMGFSLFKKSRVISDYVAKGLDVLAWDSYLTGTTKSIENVIAKTKAVSDSFGLGFGIGETAVAAGYNLPNEDHATTVADLSKAWRADAKDAEFVCWFETNKADGDWRMRPFAGAVSSWRQ